MFGRGSSAAKGSGASKKKDVGAEFNEKKKLQVDTSTPSGALAGHASSAVKGLRAPGRLKSPSHKAATQTSSAKPKLPVVTMDDLFGSPRSGKAFGAPIIDMGNAYEAEDLPDVFKQAAGYDTFDFGSDLDVDSRPLSPIVPSKNLVADSVAKKKKGLLRSTFGGSSRPFMASKSSFEAVYSHNNATQPSAESKDFEMENPFQIEAASEIKEAAVRVLSKQSENLEDKARKLFFLEQLSKPAPPVVPPRLSPSVVSVAPRKSFVKKKKGVTHYDPSLTALGIAGGASGFVPLRGIFLESKSLDVGWRLRVELLRDVAQQLMRIHDSGKAHNSLIKDGSILVAVDSFRGAIADEAGTAAPKKDDIDGVGRMKRDIIHLGVIMFEACTRRSFKDGSSPAFAKLIGVESECTKFADLDEELMGMVDDADREVRESLAMAETPGSLLELCAQCCSGDRMLRPAAMDAWDWLDSIVGDMDKAAGGSTAIADIDTPTYMSQQLKANTALMKRMVKAPKLADIGAVDYESDATSVATDVRSIASNDSFQPPSDEEIAAAKRKSKLTDFLSSGPADDSSSNGGEGRARPVSLNLSSNAAKLAMFMSGPGPAEPQDSTAQAGAEAWQQERQRRRSLDRGYMWAKQKFAGDETNDDMKSKRMTRRIVAQDNVQKFEQAWKVAAASTKTRKAEEIARLFSNQERIPQDEAMGIIKRSEAIMKKEKNLLEIKPPVIIVGDIHGQFFDLLNLISLGGEPGSKNKSGQKTVYVFLGDYVDRGDFSCETILYLLTLKGEYPDSVYLLRGNHECRTVSSYFGFREECESKYGLTVFNRCVQAFQVMPIAALIETQAGRFLCCHGGISPNITSLEQFKEFNRFVEPGMNGFLCDLLWSDPVKDAHEDGSDMTLGDFLSIDYLPNPARGCSYRYGFKALVSFLAVNKLVALIRAHEVQMGGYRYHFQELTGGKAKSGAQVMPPVVTVFSAPNYTNKYGNLGAYLKVHANPPFKPVKDKSKGKGVGFRPLELLEPVQFKEVPHPAPMQFENEQMGQLLKITSTCPYMPTTFHAFIKRALEVAAEGNDEALLERERQRASRAIAPVQMPPPRPNRSSKDVSDDDELDKLVRDATESARPKSLSAKLASTLTGKKAEDAPEVVQVKADVASKKNWKALQQLGLDIPDDNLPKGSKHATASERIAAEKFESAAENDGMNEMNPMLLAEKVELAKQKIAELHLPGTNGDADITVFKALADGSKHKSLDTRKTLGKKRSSARIKVGDKTQPESMKDVKAGLAIEEGSSTAAEEGAMSFSANELLALQMLYLLIDRQDKGLIDEEDLIAWSAEEGYAVQRQEAEICLRAVDADEDGKIGFEDYLAFAARSKDQWLVSEYSNVLSGVQQMRMQRAIEEL